MQKWCHINHSIFFWHKTTTGKKVPPAHAQQVFVLFLTYSPELTLGSGILAQSEHVFLLFSSKLVQFSSNFFGLDANFFGIWPFLDFWEGLLNLRVFSSGKVAISAFWQKAFPFPWLALCNLHLFSLKMLITVTTAVPYWFLQFDCNLISLRSFTKGCIVDFNWMGHMKWIDST